MRCALKRVMDLVMVKEIQKVKNVIVGVASVSVEAEAFGTVEAMTSEGGILSLAFPMQALAPMIMALFSAASALGERRSALQHERAVVALPIGDADAMAITVRNERHVVISLELENNAIFRFSIPPGAATRLSRSLAHVVGPGPN